MKTADYFELINKKIDGLLTPEEEAELNRYFEDDPKLKTLYQKLLKTTQLLEELPEAEPSPDLKSQILETIRQKAGYQQPSMTKITKRLSEYFPIRNRRTVFAFGFGILIGMCIFLLLPITSLTIPGSNYDNLMGTIGIGSAQVKIVEKLPIHLQHIKGNIIVRQHEEVIGISVNIDTERQLEIHFEYEPEELRFMRFEPYNDAEINLINGPSTIKTTSTGNSQYFLHFKKETEQADLINLKIFTRGIIKYNHDIVFNNDK